MAPHSSILAWKIPWTEEAGRLQSMGSWRVGHDWSNLAAAEAAVGNCYIVQSSAWCSVMTWRGGMWAQVGGDICIPMADSLHCTAETNTILERNYTPMRTSLVAHVVKNPPAMWETWVQSLGWEDPLDEGMATHSSILAWRIPMERGAWQAAVHGISKSQKRLRN